MRIIAVMSGKGGVGKSFVATGLAAALHRSTGKAAVLDADITGSSVPHLLSVPRGAHVDAEGNLVPGMSPDGIRVASMSLMLPADDKAIIWRGPLISSAITQLFNDTDWGDSEYLVVDMPPGTSDAALTVLQTLKPDGIVLVTTPQDMVTNVARRSQDMARQSEVGVFGLVMNMAYAVCPHCDERIEVFGPVDSSKEGDMPRLATLPLSPAWAELADAGRSGEVANEEFDAVAQTILAELKVAEAVS
ncbi:MAG: P-loop NTPase [Coriobacteriia bacterium]|nr:P-loop NTPase [Coriobacteriia bacterium]